MLSSRDHLTNSDCPFPKMSLGTYRSFIIIDNRSRDILGKGHSKPERLKNVKWSHKKRVIIVPKMNEFLTGNKV